MTESSSGKDSELQSAAVAVIVVSWNTRDLLARALQSVPVTTCSGRVSLYVVDNGSTDASADMVAGYIPHAVLWRLDDNLGFGQANNLAIARSSEPLILLLNSDAELRSGALDALLADLREHPEAGASGAKLVYPDGRPQPSTFAFPSLWRYSLELLGVSDALTVRGGGRAGDKNWMSGACLMLRRSALEAVGPFDPAFHMYSEEMDLCQRLWRAGWTVRYCRQAVAVHHVGQSVRRRHLEQPRLLWESRMQYHRRHHPAWEASVLALMVRVAYYGRYVVWSARGLFATAQERRRWLDRARSAWLLAQSLS